MGLHLDGEVADVVVGYVGVDAHQLLGYGPDVRCLPVELDAFPLEGREGCA